MSAWNEMSLKDYIAQNPASLLGEPLIVVNREIAVGNGGYADIMAVDGNGNTVVIEAKLDVVTDSAVVQAIGYAGVAETWGEKDIARMFLRYYPGNIRERLDLNSAFIQTFGKEYAGPSDIRIVLVGRSFDSKCISAVSFLAKRGIGIDLVSYNKTGNRDDLKLTFSSHAPDISATGFYSPRALTRPLGEKRRTATMDNETAGFFDRLTETLSASLPGGAYFRPLPLPDADVYVYYFWDGEHARKFCIPVKRMKGGISVRTGAGVGKSIFRDKLLGVLETNRTDIERRLGNTVRLKDTSTPLEDESWVLFSADDVTGVAERVLLFKEVLEPSVLKAASLACEEKSKR